MGLFGRRKTDSGTRKSSGLAYDDVEQLLMQVGIIGANLHFVTSVRIFSFISFCFISCLTTANLREISVPFRQPGGERANKQWSNGHFAQIGQAGRASTSAAWAEPYLLLEPLTTVLFSR